MSSSLNKTAIFREYIGVKSVPPLYDFPDIVGNVKEFHFILGIGTENYTTDGGTGYFKCTWDVEHFNKERVREMKEKYKAKGITVKVILSFGGLGKKNPFNPSENDHWISQAYASIKGIIQKHYKIEAPVPETNTIINTIIDGIDINYEYITPCDRFVFTKCIGELITKLKNDSDLSLNTFSISPSELVQIHYSSLYLNYPNLISWINYQFYLHHVCSKDNFVALYDNLGQTSYPANKFLPGVSTDPTTVGNLKHEDFIEAIKELNIAKPPLAGAFVWNANDSSVPQAGEEPFYLEKKIQDILCGGGVTA